jgi:hypothetical protein
VDGKHEKRFAPAPGLGRSKPVLAKAVFIAPPSDRDKEAFRANDLEIISGLPGFSSTLFDGFLQKLK